MTEIYVEFVSEDDEWDVLFGATLPCPPSVGQRIKRTSVTYLVKDFTWYIRDGEEIQGVACVGTD